VPIGITIQPNAGTTSGTNWSLAAAGGLDVVNGPWTHGPVAGTCGGRCASAASPRPAAASLSFGDQVRDSAISTLGYRVSFDAGMFRPFAKLAWFCFDRPALSSRH
jgi:outer membrane lipase/esterase